MPRVKTEKRRHRARDHGGRDAFDEFDGDPTDAAVATSRGPLLAAEDSDEWEGESAQHILAVLGGSTRKGAWSPAGELRVLCVMGGVTLDFRDADLLEGETVVTALVVMGGVDVKVPPDVHVRCEGFGLLGGFASTTHRAPDDDAPTLVFRGVAVMGGVDVKIRD